MTGRLEEKISVASGRSRSPRKGDIFGGDVLGDGFFNLWRILEDDF
jgi:hypothetical protein